MKTDTAGARFPNSWCNQPPPISNRVKGSNERLQIFDITIFTINMSGLNMRSSCVIHP